MSPEEATKVITGLEHLCYENKLEKSPGKPYRTFQFLKGLERDLPQGRIGSRGTALS